jgi:hypothetical protein
MAAKVVLLRRSKMQHNATSSKGRQGNEVYRVREHLTEAEIEKLLAALKQNRYGHARFIGVSPDQEGKWLPAMVHQLGQRTAERSSSSDVFVVTL